MKAVLPLAGAAALLLWAYPSNSELYPFVQRGSISQAEIDQIKLQGFPATYDQMIAILGSPEWRSQARDLYQMPDGRWLAVTYDGYTATGAMIREMPLEDTPGQEDRWGGGLMSWEQFGILQYLAWPQTGADMQGTFGNPAYRMADADYYRLPDGRFAVVWYSFQNQAIGYAVRGM